MQNKVWVNGNLERVRIKDMDLDYVVATMTWLLKRAPEVKFQLELYYRRKEAPEGLQFEFASLEPYGWMKGTALFTRLMARFDRLSTSYPPARPKVMDVQEDRDIYGSN
jgi:hypothetical protein